MNHFSSTQLRTLAALLLLTLIAMPLWATTVSSQGPEEEAPVGSAEEERVTAPSAPSATIFSYQGQLLDGNGSPISNAAMPMSFKLYDVATGGTACWSEDHTAINVSDGLFHVLLGQITAIDSACLTNDAYLELVVNSETLSPRELLTSVAHAVEAGTVTDGAITSAKLNIDDSLLMNYNTIRYGLIWPPSYDNRGSRSALPGFLDTLYYATKKDITVEANRGPNSGSLDSMFNLHPNSYAHWNSVTPSNPVIVTITYTGPGPFISSVILAFGGRNTHAIDYVIEYYHDDDGNGTYIWSTSANVTGNTKYEIVDPIRDWRVQKIRITVTDAGDSDQDQKLSIATIQAPSPIHGKTTGHMLDVGGDTMYGGLDMNGNNILDINSLTTSGNVGIGTTSPTAKLHVYGDTAIGQTGVGEGGQINLEAGSTGNEWIIDNRYGTYRLHHSGQEYFSLNSTGDLRLVAGDLTVNAGNVGIGTTSPTEKLHVNGSVRGNQNGALRISTGHGNLDVGAQNSTWAHFQTDRAKFYFNKGIDVDSGIVAAYTGDHLYLKTNASTRIFANKDSGNVGIGTTSPTEKLHVNGGAFIDGFLTLGAADLIMHEPSRGDAGRALVHDNNDTLTINYTGDFAGGAKVGSNLHVDGNLSVGGSCSLSPISGLSEHEGTVQAYNQTDETCEAGSITSGAYIEANLQTPEERRAGGNEGFSEGDVLCWGEDELELCETPSDPLVQGVADAKGNPIVLGAEQIKVIGPIKKGDYLVASDVPGYAMAAETPTFGIVIAQALEDFEGERGLIKAMIRKM